MLTAAGEFVDGQPDGSEARLRLRPGRVEAAEVEGEIVAVDLHAGVYFSVNGPGVLLWRALLVGSSREALEALLVDHYEISPDQAERDTVAFLAQLRERGLLEEDG